MQICCYFLSLHHVIGHVIINGSEESDAVIFMVEVYLEDGGSVFLRDIDTHLPHYNSTLGHNPKIHGMNIYSREHLILSI